MNILADSNYFYALLNPEDSLHKFAVNISNQISISKDNLLINEYILLETVTIVSQKLDKKLAILIGKSFINEEGVSLIHINNDIFKQTWDIFENTNNKNISFVDCSLIATLQNEKIDTILTFDTTDFSKLQKQYNFNLYYNL